MPDQHETRPGHPALEAAIHALCQPTTPAAIAEADRAVYALLELKLPGELEQRLLELIHPSFDVPTPVEAV